MTGTVLKAAVAHNVAAILIPCDSPAWFIKHTTGGWEGELARPGSGSVPSRPPYPFLHHIAVNSLMTVAQ